jgi:hypothetical protein
LALVDICTLLRGAVAGGCCDEAAAEDAEGLEQGEQCWWRAVAVL